MRDENPTGAITDEDDGVPFVPAISQLYQFYQKDTFKRTRLTLSNQCLNQDLEPSRVHVETAKFQSQYRMGGIHL